VEAGLPLRSPIATAEPESVLGPRTDNFSRVSCVPAYRYFGLSATAVPTTQCRSKSVSAKSLPKTGISGNLAGDFWQILSKVAEFSNVETAPIVHERPYFAAFSRKTRNLP
jgi:hypothetical protein